MSDDAIWAGSPALWTHDGIECRLWWASDGYIGCVRVPESAGIRLTGDYEDVSWALEAGFADAAAYPYSGCITSTLTRDGIRPVEDYWLARRRTDELAGALAEHVERVRQQRGAED